MTDKKRWEEILEEYEVGNAPDITHDAVGMAQRIAELEYKLNTWLNEILSVRYVHTPPPEILLHDDEE